MKFSKKSIMAVSLVVGAVMLSTSAFANYVNSSGYTACKEAGKKLIKESNYTMSVESKMLIDDEEVYKVGCKQLLNKDSDVKLNLTAHEYDAGRSSEREIYYQDGQKIVRSNYIDIDGETYDDPYDYYIYDDTQRDNIGDFFEINEGDEDLVDKEIRFAELVMDAVVGDLKNNMILVDTDNEQDTYAIDLESYQIPELINAGLSLATGCRSYGDEDFTPEELEEQYKYTPMLKVSRDLQIEGGSLKVTLDNQGRLVECTGNVNFNGKDYSDNLHNASMQVNINVSDYGTTQPQRVDLTGKIVRYNSQWRQDRIKDIDEELKDEDISEEEKQDLNEERASLQEDIESDVQETEEMETNVKVTTVPTGEQTSVAVIGGADGATSIAIN